jgi:hypothetical protein
MKTKRPKRKLKKRPQLPPMRERKDWAVGDMFPKELELKKVEL